MLRPAAISFRRSLDAIGDRGGSKSVARLSGLLAVACAMAMFAATLYIASNFRPPEIDTLFASLEHGTAMCVTARPISPRKQTQN